MDETEFFDHYEEARKLADDLGAIGMVDEAKSIRHSLIEGSSGTEIFLMLRHRLAPLLTSKKVVGVTRDRLEILYAAVDEGLH